MTLNRWTLRAVVPLLGAFSLVSVNSGAFALEWLGGGTRPRVSQLSPTCANLNHVLSLPAADLYPAVSRLLAATNDAREDCVATVARHLADSSAARVGAAAFALHVIGGVEANAALRGQPASTSGPEAAIRFFSAALPGPRLGGNWAPRHDAALQLGVLRARDAVDALRREAAGGGGTFVGAASISALAWMDRAPCRADDVADGAAVTMVMAILACGVPSFTESTATFFEHGTNFFPSALRAWTKTAAGWTHRAPTSGDDEYPRVSIQNVVAADGRSATVSILTSMVRGNGNGYRYLLRRDGNGWRVVGILFAGVA